MFQMQRMKRRQRLLSVQRQRQDETSEGAVGTNQWRFSPEQKQSGLFHAGPQGAVKTRAGWPARLAFVCGQPSLERDAAFRHASPRIEWREQTLPAVTACPFHPFVPLRPTHSGARRNMRLTAYRCLLVSPGPR